MDMKSQKLEHRSSETQLSPIRAGIEVDGTFETALYKESINSSCTI